MTQDLSKICGNIYVGDRKQSYHVSTFRRLFSCDLSLGCLFILSISLSYSALLHLVVALQLPCLERGSHLALHVWCSFLSCTCMTCTFFHVSCFRWDCSRNGGKGHPRSY